MKATTTLIHCLKCVYEEMWTKKHIIKATANVMFLRKSKLVQTVF